MRRRGFHWVYLLLGMALLIALLTAGPALATVWTDQPDYSPGSTVTISGDNSNDVGYLAGETIKVEVSGPNGYTSSVEATADGSGAWSSQVTLSADASSIGEYVYTATGQSSGATEKGSFTDLAGSTWVAAAGPTGVTFTANWWRYNTTNATGPVESNGTVTNVGQLGALVKAASATQSLKITAAATASNDSNLKFKQWGSSKPFTVDPSDPKTIVVPGWNVSLSEFLPRLYTATYADARPAVTPPSAQSATQLVSKSFDLGSFSDETDGPWMVAVDWGDGSTPDSFPMSSAGTIDPRSHTYLTPTGLLAPYHVTVTVTDNGGLWGSANFNVNVTNKPPVATFKPPLTIAECGRGMLVAPKVSATDGPGDIPTDPNQAIYTASIPLSVVAGLLPSLSNLTSVSDWAGLLDGATILDLISHSTLGSGLPNGITLADWAVATTPTGDTATGTFGGKANVGSGVYLMWVVDKYMKDLGPLFILPTLMTLQPQVLVVLPHADNSPVITAAQYTDAPVKSVDVSITGGVGDVAAPNPAYVYLSLDDISAIASKSGNLLTKPLDQWDLNSLLTDVPSVFSGISLKDGLPDGLSLDNWMVTPGDGIDTATGTLGGVANTKPGIYLIFQRDADGVPAPEFLTLIVFPEDVRLCYSGPTSGRPGDLIKLQATVKPTIWPLDTTYGDITKMWVRFRVTDPFTGAVIATNYAQVQDTGTVGDGIGTATTGDYPAPNGIFRVLVDLVDKADSSHGNEWYVGLPAAATVAFTQPNGGCMSGCGWIRDGSDKGTFAFTAGSNKCGLQGSMAYTWRGTLLGQTVNYVLTGNCLAGLSIGGSTFPLTGTFTGKASLKIVSCARGAALLGAKSNLTFVLRATDTNKCGSPDSFQLIVYEGNMVVKQVTLSYLQGGTIVIRNK